MFPYMWRKAVRHLSLFMTRQVCQIKGIHPSRGLHGSVIIDACTVSERSVALVLLSGLLLTVVSALQFSQTNSKMIAGH